jgi:hypothetical protein
LHEGSLQVFSQGVSLRVLFDHLAYVVGHLLLDSAKLDSLLSQEADIHVLGSVATLKVAPHKLIVVLYDAGYDVTGADALCSSGLYEAASAL